MIIEAGGKLNYCRKKMGPKPKPAQSCKRSKRGKMKQISPGFTAKNQRAKLYLRLLFKAWKGLEEKVGDDNRAREFPNYRYVERINGKLKKHISLCLV